MMQAILFDFFDVIHRDHQKAWLAANGFKREGGFAEASDLLDNGSISFEEYLERYASLSQRTTAQVLAEFKAYAQIDKPLIALIERLHEYYKTGLISNAHSNELRPIMDLHDLHRLFHEVCISSEVGVAKPHPDIFLRMTELLGVDPKDCVFTDDNPTNVAAAQALGMQGIVFEDYTQFVRELQPLLPDFEITV